MLLVISKTCNLFLKFSSFMSINIQNISKQIWNLLIQQGPCCHIHHIKGVCVERSTALWHFRVLEGQLQLAVMNNPSAMLGLQASKRDLPVTSIIYRCAAQHKGRVVWPKDWDIGVCPPRGMVLLSGSVALMSCTDWIKVWHVVCNFLNVNVERWRREIWE